MPRILISVYLLVVVVEGAIRKWILPDYSNEVFALKDIVLLLAFLAVLGERRSAIPRSLDFFAWIVWALMILGYAAVAGFSFESVVGLRYYLAPLPLIVVLPALLRDPEGLNHAAAWVVWLTFPIGILATIQYFSPPDSSLNAYAWSTDEIGSTFGVGDSFDALERPRVSATFSYISTYAAFLSSAWVLAWISVLHARERLGKWLAGIALMVIFFNMAMNGTRALLIIALVSGLPFALSLMRQLGAVRAQLLVVGFAVAVTYVGATVFEPFTLTAERGADPQEAIERISGTLLIPYATLSQVDFLGAGIGTTFGGYEQLGHRAASGFDEINVDRVGIELGVVGYLYLLALKILMAIKAWRVYRRCHSEPLRHWALAALLVQLSTVWQIPFYNAVAAICYFSAIGLVYWIEREEKRLLAAAPGAAAHRRRDEPLPARGLR